jgi:diacylglycerol kinase (ATP)
MIQEKIKWGVIANPKSGSRRYFRREVTVEEQLKRAGLEIDFAFSQYPDHACELARDFVERGFRHLIIIGGDGTISEAIQGVFSSSVNPQEVTFAVIPSGTGNDWARYWRIRKSLRKSLAVILKGSTQMIDIGKLTYSLKRKRTVKYFINSVGIGYDAQVVQYAEIIGRFIPGKKWVYSFSVIAGAVMHAPKMLRLYAEGASFLEDKVYTMSIGNGPYTGGGIKQTPQASPVDGKFDVMVAIKPSFFQLIRGLYHLFRSNLQEDSCVKYFRAKELKIITNRRHKIEADGILLRNGKAPFEIEILSGAVRMVVP